MKFGAIVCKAGLRPLKNIGDYMQSVAAMNFYGAEEIEFLEREELDSYKNSTKVPTIMNGWFMIEPEHFPPSDSIDPFYVSFHLTPKTEKRFFSEKTIEHLKQHQPIGCRDTDTVKLMQKYGIDAYFSGCLTLTLGKKYSSPVRENKKVYIVDLYCDNVKSASTWRESVRRLSVYCKTFAKNKNVIVKISNQIKKTTFLYKGWLKRLTYATKLYATYSSVFSDEVLCNAIYEEHRVSQKLFKDEYDKVKYVEELLRKYANARYVVTSRIHCALPCLALKTPVIFVSSSDMERDIRPTRPAGRLGGLIDLFKNAYVEKCQCVLDANDFSVDGKKIDMDFCFSNKDDYLKYKNDLICKCENFVKDSLNRLK